MATTTAQGTFPAIEQYKYDLPGVISQTVKVLAESLATPRVFQRGNALVVILPAEPRPKDRIQRTAGAPLIRLCPSSTLRLCLAKAARWYVPDKRSKTLEQTMPQPWVVETVLELGEWPHVKPLTGIILAPTLRSDETILDTPGYDEATGLFYEPGTTTFPAIPTAPTRADALEALDVLKKPFQDFPFKEPHHHSAALAAVLTVLVRHAIPGNVPMFGAKAPTAGTGKTLLVDTISAIATGRSAPKLSQPATEEEWNKQLLTCAMEGDQLVLIDNCVQTIASGELCKNITAEMVKGRVLGVHRNAEAPQEAVYFATGNNLRFRSDIVRRVIPIHLQSTLERPERRTGFTITQPLLQWTQDNRPALVCAALTILRAHYLAKDKPTVPELGSFEAWCRKICGALVWLGLPNPIDGSDEIKDEDEEREQIRELLSTWHTLYKEVPTTLNTAKQDIELHTQDKHAPRNTHHALFDALKEFDHSRCEALNAGSIASNLKSVVGRIVCGKVLTREKTKTRYGYPWKVTIDYVCSCEACEAPPNPARGKGNLTNTGSSGGKASPASQPGVQNEVNANNLNGFTAGDAANQSFTPASHLEDDYDDSDIPF